MRLLKTHSHTSERPGYEARKNAKKRNRRKRRHYKKANHPSKPAAYRQCGGGGETTRRYGKTNHRQNPPAYRRRGGGVRDEEGRIEVEHRREDKGNQTKPLPQATIVSGGARQKAKTNTKWKGGPTHSPARGGKVPSRKRISKEKTKQRASQGKKTKHTVLCHCVSSQITLAAPRLGAEEGVGRTTKKNAHENL